MKTPAFPGPELEPDKKTSQAGVQVVAASAEINKMSVVSEICFRVQATPISYRIRGEKKPRSKPSSSPEGSCHIIIPSFLATPRG